MLFVNFRHLQHVGSDLHPAMVSVRKFAPAAVAFPIAQMTPPIVRRTESMSSSGKPVVLTDAIGRTRSYTTHIERLSNNDAGLSSSLQERSSLPASRRESDGLITVIENHLQPCSRIEFTDHRTWACVSCKSINHSSLTKCEVCKQPQSGNKPASATPSRDNIPIRSSSLNCLLLRSRKLPESCFCFDKLKLYVISIHL
jgi:hypothetical protein